MSNLNNTSINRRKTFSIGEKLEIIELIRSGKKQTDVAKVKGLSQSTFQIIWSQREKIAQNYCQFNVTTKKARKSTFPEVYEALVKWFDSVWSKRFPLNGVVLTEKACEIVPGTKSWLAWMEATAWH